MEMLSNKYSGHILGHPVSISGLKVTKMFISYTHGPYIPAIVKHHCRTEPVSKSTRD